MNRIKSISGIKAKLHDLIFLFSSKRVSFNNFILFVILSVVTLCFNKLYAQSLILEVKKSTGVKLKSIGAEFDPHFFAQNLIRNDGSKSEDWDNIIVKRVKDMNLQSFRVMVLPHWFEPVNDNDDPYVTTEVNFTFNSIEMESLYKVLDLAEKENIDVTIVLWGASPSHFLGKGNYGDWMVAANDYNEWAENFAALVKHLVLNKKYTCIKEITPVNEPDWAFIGKGKVNGVGEYIKMCQILDDRFKKEGLRKKIKFNLSDNSDGGVGAHYFLDSCSHKLSKAADIFNSHTYIFGYDTPNSDIIAWEKKNIELAALCGKQHYIGEFGSNQCDGASRQKDIDLYERGVLMIRIALNLLNAGACGISYWGLLDQYYSKNDDYKAMQQLGLWKYVKNEYNDEPYFDSISCDYEVRPQYYSYSLMTRFLLPKSEIYPIKTGYEFLAASGFKLLNGKWVYVVANQEDESVDLKIVNHRDKIKGNYKVYNYSKDSYPNDGTQIEALQTIDCKNNSLRYFVPSNSVIFFCEY
ncbi:MAG: hypothetical protein Q4F97_02190 [Bacteroidales bacterium]|nr:hypothetical protein [Bacteroidales bacterium]